MDVTAQWSHSIEHAACYARQTDGTRVTVHATMDGAEAAQGLNGLSFRRAEVVVDQLVELGVPRERIAINDRTHRQPAVYTAAGADEPLNRLVVITHAVAGQPTGVRCISGPPPPPLPSLPPR